jgi:hypothetical protein
VVSYLVLFAGKAVRRYAHAEAARALREALTHCGQMPQPEADRRRMEPILLLRPAGSAGGLGALSRSRLRVNLACHSFGG